MNIAVVTFGRTLFYFKPDTSLERDVTRDFFLPDFICRTYVVPVLFIRISKPCKAVLPEFANRYYEGFSYGVIIGGSCRKRIRMEEVPAPVSLDGSAVFPNSYYDIGRLGSDEARFTFECDGKNSLRVTIPDINRNDINDCLKAVSGYCTLRTGDMLALEALPAVMAKRGTHVSGDAFGVTLFDFGIK
ncbi:MAG: hypothetical protein LKK19_00725 [Bacteroidales bacterium]|jgi:hypothetical protein|nr:hypothetical protein [Bacteroidales bacterium]MCI2121212.1 hypothetical protein [Bacteroidales bacterium]MCI2145998.1 hypothetical protein [Bacteroidales bacterium]